MKLFEKYKKLLPKNKSKKELNEHYDKIELEKGDYTAMLIAGLLTFGPLVLIISLVYICIALLFGM